MLKPKYTVEKLIEDLKRYDQNLGVCYYDDDMIQIVTGICEDEGQDVEFEEDNPYHSHIRIQSMCACRTCGLELDDYSVEDSNQSTESAQSNLSNKISDIVPSFIRQTDWNG